MNPAQMNVNWNAMQVSLGSAMVQTPMVSFIAITVDYMSAQM